MNLEEVKSTLKQWPTEMILSLLFTNPSGCVCSVTCLSTLSLPQVSRFTRYERVFNDIHNQYNNNKVLAGRSCTKGNTKLRSMLS